MLAARAFESFGDLPLTGCFLVGAAVDPLASNAGDMVLACGSVITERMHDGRVTEVVRDRVL